jgi:hypothetical protein
LERCDSFLSSNRLFPHSQRSDEPPSPSQQPIDMLVQDSCLFHDNLSVYKSFGGASFLRSRTLLSLILSFTGIVLAADEGANIAAAMGPKHKCAILQVRLRSLSSLPNERSRPETCRTTVYSLSATRLTNVSTTSHSSSACAAFS